jgi:hypothetical protein
MKTSSAKAKGRRAAAAVRELLLSYAPDINPQDIAVTPSGVNGPDVYLSQAAKGVYPLAIECKNQEALNIWAALKQSREHALEGSGDHPVVFFTRNREGKIYVALEAESFLKLIR